MCVTVCGKFVPDKVVVASYDNRIRDKFPAKWGVQIAGMIFLARSSQKKDFQSILLSENSFFISHYTADNTFLSVQSTPHGNLSL